MLLLRCGDEVIPRSTLNFRSFAKVTLLHYYIAILAILKASDCSIKAICCKNLSPNSPLPIPCLRKLLLATG